MSTEDKPVNNIVTPPEEKVTNTNSTPTTDSKKSAILKQAGYIHTDTPHTPVTLRQVEQEINSRVINIQDELIRGFELIKHQPKSISIFGSARLTADNPFYKKARELGFELARRGYSIVTGGGPGIMAAGNQGAKDAHGRSVGLNILLPHEQNENPYITHRMRFHYFFTRKVMLTFSAEAYVFFPGGFGTMDEFFEILTLVQTKKIEYVPLFLFGTAFWNPLIEYMKKVQLPYGTIDGTDLELFTVTDSVHDIVTAIEKAPVRNGVRVQKED